MPTVALRDRGFANPDCLSVARHHLADPDPSEFVRTGPITLENCSLTCGEAKDYVIPTTTETLAGSRYRGRNAGPGRYAGHLHHGGYSAHYGAVVGAVQAGTRPRDGHEAARGTPAA